MNNPKLLIIGIIMVAAASLLLSYNAIDDHYTYTEPIKNSYIYHNITHVDSFAFKDINDTFADNMFDISLIDEETTKISFRNHGNLPPWKINDFEDFERVFEVGDNFVTRCQEDAEKSTSWLTIFEFNGTRHTKGGLWVDFIHADGSSDGLIPCNYPQVVDYSTNIFELPVPEHIYQKNLLRVFKNATHLP